MGDPARKPEPDDDQPTWNHPPGEDLTQEEWEAAWDEELTHRIGEVERGEVETIPWEQVRAEIDAKLADIARSRAAAGRR